MLKTLEQACRQVESGLVLPSCQVYLPALAHNVIASAILLHALGALGAGLGVRHHPVASLAVATDLLIPLVPPVKRPIRAKPLST